ncbi:MAG TPA: PEP-CTERM sorting domain-containing protein [Planctomycetota bacterium]|nr:PEP-CTERM sorting domain-containing protein [Planctomycetota bacterium]
MTETPHFAMTDAMLQRVDGVSVYEENRSNEGNEFDNLLVTSQAPNAVPEPGSAALLALGAAGLAARRGRPRAT